MPADAPQHDIAFISLGSNLGNREEYLRSGLRALQRVGIVHRISSFYETDAVGDIAQPDFLNAVVELHTPLGPEELLSALLQIEQENGRDRGLSPPKGPRTLDLDLLSHGSTVMTTPTLSLPHPAMAERAFVLVPLAEIAPEWRHPLSGKTAAQLLSAFETGNPAFSIRKLSTSQ